MKKQTFIYIVALLFVNVGFAQENFSFYQLRDYVPQTQSLTPAYIPKSKVTVSLPVLNSSINYVGDFAIKDILVPQSNGNNAFDIDQMYSVADEENYFTMDFLTNLFHVQVNTKAGSFSLFTNIKGTLDLRVTDDFLKLLAEGNRNSIGQTLNFEEAVNLSVHKEFGIGYSNKILNDKLTFGVRFKYLNGTLHASTKDDAALSLYTDPVDYNLTLQSNNLTMNTAGIALLADPDAYPDEDFGSYATWSDNHGFAIDLGASYDITERWNVAASVNDIGYINWEENVKNYEISDATYTFTGAEIDVNNTENIGEEIENEFEENYQDDENSDPFTSNLTVTSYVSGAYKFGKNNNHKAGVTVFNKFIFNQFNPSAAVSYNYLLGKKTTIGLVSSFWTYADSPKFGVNLATSLGPIQFYLATDNLLSVTAPVEEAQVVDFRFGFNILVGYGKNDE